MSASSGTFRFAGLHGRLKARVRLCRPGDRAGTVDFLTRDGGGAAAVWCLDDEDFAAEQSERGWKQLVPPSAAFEQQHFELLHSAWERRDAPRRHHDRLRKGAAPPNKPGADETRF